MIGIRREDKNRWERRVPLTPEHVAELASRQGIDVCVQPSPIRAFSDEAYRRSGARISDDLSACRVILGVKELPLDGVAPGSVYVFFSHVIKGQSYNMPMLRRLMETGCTLVEYERIRDDRGKRLIFFGRHAGIAGMVDALWALGRRLAWEGIGCPFAACRQSHQYADLEDVRIHLGRVADAIRHEGVPLSLHPLVFGFTGSGNVSRGAQEIFALLPSEEVNPDELGGLASSPDLPRNVVFRTLFGRRDRVERIGGGRVDEAELAAHPELYRSAMGRYLPHLTVLVNGIYWDPHHPRVASLQDLRDLWSRPAAPRLRVIGDISCDLRGSVEATVRLTTPGDPVYVYDPMTGEAISGVAGRGPVILAVDNLPCELPVDASQHFGDALMRFVPSLQRCDWDKPFEELSLPPEIRRAVVVHRGRLTPDYLYLDRHLAERARTER